MPSEQTDEVAWEDMPPTLAPVFVQQLTAPPTILWRRGDGDDIARLEVELLLDRRLVVVHRLDCPGVSAERQCRQTRNSP